MILAAMSMRCFHCVDFDVMNSSAELLTFARRISGSRCPLCGDSVKEYVLLVDESDVDTLRDRTGPWDRGAGPTSGFERFFTERESAPSEVHDVTRALRGQVSGARDAKRKEQCAALTRKFAGMFAFEQGQQAWERGELGRARKAFQVAAEAEDDELRAHAEFQLGNIDNAEGDFPAAVRRFRSATRTPVREVRAAALLYLGIALRKLGDLDGARTAYRDCMACEVPFVRGMAAFRLGTVLEEQGRSAKARDMYEFAVELDSEGSYEAAVNLGAMEEAAGRWERARSLWEYAFRSPDEEVKASAAFNLGRAWERAGRLRKAKSFYRIAARAPDREIAQRARAYRRTASKVWRDGR